MVMDGGTSVGARGCACCFRGMGVRVCVGEGVCEGEDE